MRVGYFCKVCGSSEYHRHCFVCEEPMFEGFYKSGKNTCQRCKNEARAKRERSQKTGFIVVTDPGEVPLRPGLVLWREEVKRMRELGSFNPETILSDKSGTKYQVTAKMKLVRI